MIITNLIMELMMATAIIIKTLIPIQIVLVTAILHRNLPVMKSNTSTRTKLNTSTNTKREKLIPAIIKT